MCEATTLLVASLATTALSTGVGLYGQAMQQQQAAQAAEASAAYNAQVAENQAATQRELAQNEIAKGISERERQQRSAARAMGEMRAQMGASGFTLDSGSNLSLLAESAQEHQYDSNLIMSNANQAAWQHLVGASQAENQKSYSQWQGDNAHAGDGLAALGMAGTLLGGIGSGLGTYGSYLKNNPAQNKGALTRQGQTLFNSAVLPAYKG